MLREFQRSVGDILPQRQWGAGYCLWILETAAVTVFRVAQAGRHDLAFCRPIVGERGFFYPVVNCLTVEPVTQDDDLVRAGAGSRDQLADDRPWFIVKDKYPAVWPPMADPMLVVALRSVLADTK
jgi:hypothetical protein